MEGSFTHEHVWGSYKITKLELIRYLIIDEVLVAHFHLVTHLSPLRSKE